MEYKELYYTLQDIFPNYAEEILRGLFLLNDGLEKTKESIGNIPYKILKGWIYNLSATVPRQPN